MQISTLTQQKKDPNRVNVFLDGEFWVGVTKDELIKFGLFKGKDIDQENKVSIEKASKNTKLLDRVYKFILLRPRSEKEIMDYLVIRKKVDKAEATSVLQKLKEVDVVSDIKFAKWFIENKLAFKTEGFNKIKAELIKKGVPREIIAEQIAEQKQNIDPEIQKEKLKQVIEKLRKQIKHKDERELQNKIMQRLMARGFNYDEVKEFVKDDF